MASVRNKLEAQAFSKIKEYFDGMDNIAQIMDGLRENSLIEEGAAKEICGIKDKMKRNRYSKLSLLLRNYWLPCL